MALDRKYGRVTTERGDIAEDEPVVVFRAQDGLLPNVLEYYRELCYTAGSPHQHLDAIWSARELVTNWQAAGNKVKMPPTSGGSAGVAIGYKPDEQL